MENPQRFWSKNSSESTPSPLNLSRLLANNTQREWFQQSIGRKLITLKYGALDNFYLFQFPDLLTSQDVSEFILDCGPYYPDLVRVFYCNLEAKTGGFTSWVKGVPIKMTLVQVGECLGLPTSGEKIHPDFLCEWEGYDKKQFYLSLCHYSEAEIHTKKLRTGTSYGKNVLSVGHLTADDRLLHYFLCYMLVPKASNYSQINDFEMQFLYAIKNDKSINWAYLFVNHMLCQKDRPSGLPYATVISRILSFCNVDTSHGIPIPMTTADNQIGIDILHKMGISWDPTKMVYNHKSDLLEAAPNQPAPEEHPVEKSQIR